MADLVFNKTTGKLRGLGGEWSAVSGTRTIGALLDGTYKVPPGSLMTGTNAKSWRAGVQNHKKYDKSSYGDKKGFHWFLWLGQGNLAIHPDGNVPGTLGCIGITDPDTSDLFEKLKALRHRELVVEVTSKVEVSHRPPDYCVMPGPGFPHGILR